MKRWLIRITISLVLGAVTTVGVAWGFALSPSEFGDYLDVTDLPCHNDWWSQHVTETRKAGTKLLSTKRGARRVLAFYGSRNSMSGPGPIAVLEHYGWPHLALQWWYVEGDGRQHTLSTHDLRFIRGAYLPLGPVLRGLLINTLFYGVIWFGIFFGFGSARRAVRKKRGRCPKCGYQLRGQFDAGCSECGWNRLEDDA